MPILEIDTTAMMLLAVLHVVALGLDLELVTRTGLWNSIK